MKKLSFINRFLPSYQWKVAAIIICGVVVGGGGLFMYLLRAHTYLGDEPSACVNCHIMAPYYATWFHSSHSRDATCNDCHVPHENVVKKWTFKGMVEAIRCHLLPMHWYLILNRPFRTGCKRCLRNNEIKSIYLWKRN